MAVSKTLAILGTATALATTTVPAANAAAIVQPAATTTNETIFASVDPFTVETAGPLTSVGSILSNNSLVNIIQNVADLGNFNRITLLRVAFQDANGPNAPSLDANVNIYNLNPDGTFGPSIFSNVLQFRNEGDFASGFNSFAAHINNLTLPDGAYGFGLSPLSGQRLDFSFNQGGAGTSRFCDANAQSCGAAITGVGNIAFEFSGTFNAAGSPAGIPETSSWAMMIAGFGFIGGALRGRRRDDGYKVNSGLEFQGHYTILPL